MSHKVSGLRTFNSKGKYAPDYKEYCKWCKSNKLGVCDVCTFLGKTGKKEFKNV